MDSRERLDAVFEELIAVVPDLRETPLSQEVRDLLSASFLIGYGRGIDVVINKSAIPAWAEDDEP